MFYGFPLLGPRHITITSSGKPVSCSSQSLECFFKIDDEQALEHLFVGNRTSCKWLNGFFRFNLTLLLQVGQNLPAMADLGNEEKLRKYFELIYRKSSKYSLDVILEASS